MSKPTRADMSRARLAGVKLIKIHKCNLQVWPLFYSLKTIATLETVTLVKVLIIILTLAQWWMR